VEGTGSLDRSDASGILALHAGAASVGQITALLAPFSPALAARLSAMAIPPGAARLKLALDIGRDAERPDRANARAVLDLNVPQFKGSATVIAKPALAAFRSIDLDALGRSEISITSRLSAERGATLLALLGLDRAVAAGEGALQFEGSTSGVWHTPLRLNARLWGAGIDVETQPIPGQKRPRPAPICAFAASTWRRHSVSSRRTAWRKTSGCSQMFLSPATG